MLFHAIAGITAFLSCSVILAQIFYLPYIISQTDSAHGIVMRNVEIFKVLEKEISSDLSDLAFLSVSKRSINGVFCENGRPGPPGPDGRDGQPGIDGPKGIRGLDARDIMEEIQQKQECIICPQGEVGPIGAPGERGEQGDKGNKGIPGIPGQDGLDGEQGEEGAVGAPGPIGRRGRKGADGKSAMGGIGEPGPKGVPGAKGGPGLQGPRGKRNYIYGPPGPIGQPGSSGLDGIAGNPGERGPKGPPGDKGADIKFCPCPMELELLKAKQGKPHRPSSPPSSSDFIDITSDVPDDTTPEPPSTILPAIVTENSELKTEIEGIPVETTSTTQQETTSTTTTLEQITSTHSVFGNAPGAERNTDGESTPHVLHVAESDELMIDVPTEFGSQVSSNQMPLDTLQESEEDDYEEVTQTTRRFRYVTKRPIVYT